MLVVAAADAITRANEPRSGEKVTASLAVTACGDNEQRFKAASVCGELLLLRFFLPDA